jgi:glycosyltransferase involved in cell wall biosynthesis
MSPKIAFLTTVYPTEKEYLFDFFDSLQNQTYKEFDVIVVNDGYKEFDAIKDKYSSLRLIELIHSSTPAKNREYGINYCIDNKYEVLIFGDSDDYFDKNRVEKILWLLEDNDIVVNDLSLFNENGIYEEKYISNRVENLSKIDLEFIKDKNIFGMSNTALKISKLESVCFDKDVVAVDWVFFKKLLYQGLRAIFTNETISYYRQYTNNTIGLAVENDKYYFWWEKKL